MTGGGGNLEVARGVGGKLEVSIMHIGASALEPGIAASAGGQAVCSHTAGQGAQRIFQKSPMPEGGYLLKKWRLWLQKNIIECKEVRLIECEEGDTDFLCIGSISDFKSWTSLLDLRFQRSRFEIRTRDSKPRERFQTLKDSKP